MVTHGQCCHFLSTLCLSGMLVKQDRVRLGCHSWPVWEELVLSEPANERPVTNHIHDCHMMNIQSMMSNTKNGHRSTAPSVYQTHHSFNKIFQYFELHSSEPIPKLVSCQSQSGVPQITLSCYKALLQQKYKVWSHFPLKPYHNTSRHLMIWLKSVRPI